MPGHRWTRAAVSSPTAGPRRVLFDVRGDNAVAQCRYEWHGFVPIGRRRRYYQPSGTDALVMARTAT